MKNCLNCGKFPFCDKCNNYKDKNKECFVKREKDYFIKKENGDK